MIDAHSASAAATLAPAQGRDLVDRQLAMLTRLAEIGMEIAEAAGRQATGGPPADGGALQIPPIRDPALVFVRVARAVRLTIALQSRLTADLAARERGESRAAADRAGERRFRLRRLVERAVEIEHDGDGRDSAEAWALAEEARERLADAELDAALEGVTFADAVERICRDLGLSPQRTAGILAAAGPPRDVEERGAAPAPGCPGRRSRGPREAGGDASSAGGRMWGLSGAAQGPPLRKSGAGPPAC